MPQTTAQPPPHVWPTQSEKPPMAQVAPLCISLKGRTPEEWLMKHHNDLARTLNHQGFLLIRGLDIKTPADLHHAVSALPGRPFPYEHSLSNALRVNHTDRVFTANEAPAHLSIFLHHEMVQTPKYPDLLLFNCE